MTNNLFLNSTTGFTINANKLNVTSSSPVRYSPAHIHDLCEIYVNLSGNVSFMVEKSLYTIQPGDIIITKPFEYHHCVYNDSSDHLHYWFLFSAKENPDLFSFITGRKRGTNNLIRLPQEDSLKFLTLCEELFTANSQSYITALSCFFRMMSYIEQGLQKYNVSEANNHLPPHVSGILSYINKNFASIDNIRALASEFNISITTLERYFKKYLAITPKRYLEDKKLSNACRLLRQNLSVTEACFESGFDDYSHFIYVFKKNMKTTPLKYKKNISYTENR